MAKRTNIYERILVSYRIGNTNCFVPFLQIIFLFYLNNVGIQQIFKGFGWIITIKYYFCSVKTIKT